MELIVEKRTLLGKKVGTLRRGGNIPGEIYGNNEKNFHITVEEKSLMQTFRKTGNNTLITLQMEKESFPVIISDIQFHPLSGKPISVDFHKIKKGQKIKTNITLVLKGDAPALKNGFDLIQTLNELEVEALPDHIPHEFFVDVTSLENTNNDIAVKNLNIPKNIKILTPIDTIVVAVTEKKKEETELPPPIIEASSEEAIQETKEIT